LNENRSHGERAVYAEFGRRLQARMIQLGWNQSELSRRAEAYLPKPAKGQVQGHSLGRDRISSYIRGKYLPRPEGLEAIAKALQREPADLLPPKGVPSVVNNPDMLRSTKDSKDSTMRMRVDEWRRMQPDLPSRAAAIRRLVELGLKKGK
jgi:transcriptional regulator with XRE-family HTH domain